MWCVCVRVVERELEVWVYCSHKIMVASNNLAFLFWGGGGGSFLVILFVSFVQCGIHHG